MCWSGEASAVLAIVGVATTGYAAYKKEPPQFYIPLAFFTLMEILQAFTYSVIDQCGLPSNQIATLLGYLHIAFQPFFINYLCLYFVPKKVSEKIAPFVFAACFAATILMLLKLYPFSWAGACQPGTILCGQNLCSVSGYWHIAWNVPFTNLFGLWPTYLIVALFLPILYGSWRMSLYNIAVGILPAYLLSSNPNEQPAIWCLLSIGLLMLIVKTPLRDILVVHDWWLWPRSWSRDGTGNST